MVGTLQMINLIDIIHRWSCNYCQIRILTINQLNIIAKEHNMKTSTHTRRKSTDTSESYLEWKQ